VQQSAVARRHDMPITSHSSIERLSKPVTAGSMSEPVVKHPRSVPARTPKHDVRYCHENLPWQRIGAEYRASIRLGSVVGRCQEMTGACAGSRLPLVSHVRAHIHRAGALTARSRCCTHGPLGRSRLSRSLHAAQIEQPRDPALAGPRLARANATMRLGSEP
jgi:hypothetical protein